MEDQLANIRQQLKEMVGMTDEDFKTYMSFTNNVKLTKGGQELLKYKIIAEVISSKYCSAGLKPGQKFTFSTLPAMLLPQESDCPLCIRALGPLGYQIKGFWDRITEGVDPNQGMWQITECLDPGVDKGGLGHVVFKISAQKTK